MAKYLETEEFLSDFNNGVKTSFDALFHEYWSQLYVFACKMTANHDKAEDIAIQAFVNLFQSNDHIDSLGTVRTKLYTLVRDYSLEYVKYQLVLTEAQMKYLTLVEQDPQLFFVQLEGSVRAALYKLYKGKL